MSRVSCHLMDLVDVNPRSRNIKAIPEDTPVSFVPMASVSEKSASIVKWQERPLHEVKKGFTPFQENDVLFAKITPCMENGKLACVENMPHRYGFGSTEFHVLRAKTHVLPKYIYYFFRRPDLRSQSKQRMVGAAGQQRVPADFLKLLEIRYCPLSEQHKIVEVLEQADALLKRRAVADEKAQKFIPALFISLFGELGANSHGWEETLLGNLEICEINPRLPRNSIDSDLEVSFLPMNEVDQVWGKINCTQVKKYEEVKTGYTYFRDDDVLFAKITPCMENGKAAIAKNLTNGIGFGSTEFHVLRAGPRTVPEWLFGLIRLERFRELAKASFTGSAGQQRVPVDCLRNFRVSVPPFDMQLNFANILNQLHKQVELFTSTRTKLDFLFSTLLQRAFSGELTAKWRESHMRELMEEMEIQARELNLETTL